jgi:hypothetical protein
LPGSLLEGRKRIEADNRMISLSLRHPKPVKFIKFNDGSPPQGLSEARRGDVV